MAVRAPLRIGRALEHRNYRLFFIGQGISLIGTWLTRFATVWMVYRLTHSGALLGLVAFFGSAPSSVIAPIAGVLVDRWERRRVVVVTQVAAMLQSAAPCRGCGPSPGRCTSGSASSRPKNRTGP